MQPSQEDRNRHAAIKLIVLNVNLFPNSGTKNRT